MPYAIARWSRTPDTWTHEYNFTKNKTLISFANEGDYKTYNNGWQTVSTTLPSQSQFEADGIDDVSVLNRTSTTFTQDMTNDGTLGVGLKFSTTIDLKKYFDITEIRKI
jgi:hypothetical protein